MQKNNKIKKAIAILNAPFPEPLKSPASWNINIAITSIVTLLLLIFQPFGLSALPLPNRYWLIAGYGLVTFIAITIFLEIIPRIIPQWFKTETWKVWKHILFLMLLLMIIGLLNLSYTAIFIKEFNLTWQYLLHFETITILTGIFPVAATIAASYIRQLKKNIKIADDMSTKLNQNTHTANQTPETIIIKGQNAGEYIQLSIQNLLFIMADGNYVHIYFTENNIVKQKLMRNTLQHINQLLIHYPAVMQCHRAFIINTNQIHKVSGNAQGLNLKLKKGNKNVPVSRKYVAQIRQIVPTSLNPHRASP